MEGRLGPILRRSSALGILILSMRKDERSQHASFRTKLDTTSYSTKVTGSVSIVFRFLQTGPEGVCPITSTNRLKCPTGPAQNGRPVTLPRRHVVAHSLTVKQFAPFSTYSSYPSVPPAMSGTDIGLASCSSAVTGHRLFLHKVVLHDAVGGGHGRVDET